MGCGASTQVAKPEEVPEALPCVSGWLRTFSSRLRAADFEGAAGLLAAGEQNVFWRDLVSFTWNIHTFEGQQAIQQALERTVPGNEPVEDSWVPCLGSGDKQEGHFKFENKLFRGRGYVRINQEGRATTLMTAAQELKGFEEHTDATNSRAHGYQPGCSGKPGEWSAPVSGRPAENWQQRQLKEAAEIGIAVDPYVLVIGGGQCGIMLGARLRQLGIPHVVMDKQGRPGDAWRNRYKSLVLHDPVWYDHFPYIPFPENWPVFTPKDMLGDWMEMYTKVMQVNYWSKTECKKASFDEVAGKWTVEAIRDGAPVTIRRLKAGVEIAKMQTRAVELSSGEVLDADLVVCATGYGNMSEWIGALVDEQTKDKVGRVWGLGSGEKKDPGPWEGELRNMWKPTKQKNLWCHGGNLHQSRQHSLFLALQLKARYEGLETPMYPAFE